MKEDWSFDSARRDRPAKPLMVPNSDLCELAGTLNAEELAVVKQVRAFMERKVAPIINKYWPTTPFRSSCCPR